MDDDDRELSGSMQSAALAILVLFPLLLVATLVLVGVRYFMGWQ